MPTVGGRAPKILSKQELTGILEPRAAEIAKLVYRDLEKVGLEKEIRSGVVLVGGGAEMDGMVEMVEQVFDQQARKGVPRGFGGLADTVERSGVGGGGGPAAVGIAQSGAGARKRPRKRSGESGGLVQAVVRLVVDERHETLIETHTRKTCTIRENG